MLPEGKGYRHVERPQHTTGPRQQQRLSCDQPVRRGALPVPSLRCLAHMGRKSEREPPACECFVSSLLAVGNNTHLVFFAVMCTPYGEVLMNICRLTFNLNCISASAGHTIHGWHKRQKHCHSKFGLMFFLAKLPKQGSLHSDRCMVTESTPRNLKKGRCVISEYLQIPRDILASR